jgi:hypothetical protein
LVWGSFGTLIGLGLVLVGLIASIIPVAVVGFALVVASVGFAIQSLRRPEPVSTGRGSSARGGKRPAPAKNGLKARMEHRLHRRFDQGY